MNVSYNTLKSSSTRLETLTIHWFWTFKLITTPKISFLIQHSLFSCYQSLFRCHSYIFCPSLHAAEEEECLKIWICRQWPSLTNQLTKKSVWFALVVLFLHLKIWTHQICPTKCTIFRRGKVLTTEKICGQVKRNSSFFIFCIFLKKIAFVYNI